MQVVSVKDVGDGGIVYEIAEVIAGVWKDCVMYSVVIYVCDRGEQAEEEEKLYPALLWAGLVGEFTR